MYVDQEILIQLHQALVTAGIAPESEPYNFTAVSTDWRLKLTIAALAIPPLYQLSESMRIPPEPRVGKKKKAAAASAGEG
jgi:hypothetical protein